MDSAARGEENGSVLRPGASRKQLAHRLKAAYADGLLSHDTFNHRLDRALSPGVIDARRLIGDLSPRAGRAGRAVTRWLGPLSRRLTPFPDQGDSCRLLGLDWTGATSEMLIGRHHECDVVLDNDAVSRRHARVFFRDGHWIIQDLESTNGTCVNDVRVGRCRLSPGDRIRLATVELRVD